MSFCNQILAGLVFILLIFGCGGGKSTTSTKSDQEKDFDKTISVPALKSSVLTIPQNVQLTSVASSGKKSKDPVSDDLGGNVYGTIGSTIKFSEEIKNNILEFLEFILEDKDLANAELGTLIETEQGTITAYKIEDISNVSGEVYKWKLSLHFFFSSTPNIICRFTFVNGKMKGQMLQQYSSYTAYKIGAFTHNIYKYFNFDIRFDGTTSPQTLDVDYTIDLSHVFRFAEQYWPQLTKEQFDSLDIGQTGKSSIRINFDGKEYGISGTNYSPGANLEATLKRQYRLFSEDRSTYSFRAKSITGAIDGAKMEVAIPIDTLEDISAIWENDSFSVLFQAEILGFLDEYIQQLIDENDDTFINNSDYLGTALLNSVNLNGDTLAEQGLGFKMIYKYRKTNLGIQSFAEHGAVMTTEEFDAATTFWGTNSFTDFSISSLTDLNNFLSSSNVSNSDEEKQIVYYTVMAPAVIAFYQTNPTGISISDVISVLTADNSISSNNFKKLIETNILIVNPAFFEKDNGFLGTFDGTNFNAYDFQKDILAVGSKPTNFETFNALDLTTLTAIKPNDVYNLTIEVK